MKEISILSFTNIYHSEPVFNFRNSFDLFFGKIFQSSEQVVVIYLTYKFLH